MEQRLGNMRGREVWFDVVEKTGGPVGTGGDIVGGVVMDGEISKYDCKGLFSVAINGWDEEADVLRERIGIGVLRGPVLSDKLMDLAVKKLRAKLVIGRGWNAGDSIVRGIDGWVLSFVFLGGRWIS
jgi:hypothetical protein